LIRALGDRNEEVRQEAATALAWINGFHAVEPLIGALKNKDENVREWAANALGRIGDRRAVRPLIAALRDGSQKVRSRSAKALGWIGDPRGIDPLVLALGDTDMLVAENAAKALDIIETDWPDRDISEQEMACLASALQREKPPVKQHLINVLEKLGSAEAVAILREATRDSRKKVKRAATKALKNIPIRSTGTSAARRPLKT
jgi:HEAT repeat protein